MVVLVLMVLLVFGVVIHVGGRRCRCCGVGANGAVVVGIDVDGVVGILIDVVVGVGVVDAGVADVCGCWCWRCL